MENEENKFRTYEAIRRSGVTNMFDVRMICTLSGNLLNREDCLYIMKHYEELYEKYIGDISKR